MLIPENVADSAHPGYRKPCLKTTLILVGSTGKGLDLTTRKTINSKEKIMFFFQKSKML
jgi:hypothetical protein